MLNKYCLDKDDRITVFLYCPEVPAETVVHRVYSNQTIGTHTHRFADISPKAVTNIQGYRKRWTGFETAIT